MAYKYKKNLSARGNYGDKRSLKKIKYAVVHYTGNDGDTDENNGKYFKNNVVECSAHYFIDHDSVTQSVPDNYVAWAVGSMGLLDQGSPYASKGGKYFGKCTNTNSISFELCDPVRGGGIKLNKDVRENAVKFIAKKMVELNIPANNLIRHFDVNGKLCPIYFVTAEQDWLEFKADVKDEINRLKGKKNTNTTTSSQTKYTLPKLPGRGYFDYWDNGTQVKYVQKILNYLVDAKLEVDGIYGNLTIAAVKKFQKKYGLVVDGLFGKKSLAKAKALLKKDKVLK